MRLFGKLSFTLGLVNSMTLSTVALMQPCRCCDKALGKKRCSGEPGIPEFSIATDPCHVTHCFGQRIFWVSCFILQAGGRTAWQWLSLNCRGRSSKGTCRHLSSFCSGRATTCMPTLMSQPSALCLERWLFRPPREILKAAVDLWLVPPPSRKKVTTLWFQV